MGAAGLALMGSVEGKETHQGIILVPEMEETKDNIQINVTEVLPSLN